MPVSATSRIVCYTVSYSTGRFQYDHRTTLNEQNLILIADCTLTHPHEKLLVPPPNWSLPFTLHVKMVI